MIHWITERLGTAPYADVSADARYAIVDVRDLVDRQGNTPLDARAKIDEAIHYLRDGKTVLICCDYGLSRSNAIAAGVLAEFGDLTFEDAVQAVVAQVGSRGLSLDVLSAARGAIEGRDRLKARSKTSVGSILITGSSGLIGLNLMPRLASEHTVISPSRHDVDLMHGSLDLDFLVREHNVKVIIHLANPRIYTTNSAVGETLVMLKNVLEVWRTNDLRLLYPSSWEIYSGYCEPLLAAENLPPLPKSSYGQTKYLSEMLIEQYVRLYNLDRAVLRMSPIYGINSDKPKFITAFLEKALRNEDIVTHRYTNGFPLLDLLAVEDAVSAIELCLKGGFSGYLNIGTGVRTSTAKVAEMVRRTVGSHSRIVHRAIADDAPNIAMNTRQAQEVLGWRAEVGLQEGLRRLILSKVR
jgi:nucleoside-diphosphate-sugar epimerase